jgi:hypothetical protein
MKKKPTIYDQIVFDDRTVIVRPITDEERCQYYEGDYDNQYYVLIPLHSYVGLPIIIMGGPEVAFHFVEEIEGIPEWVH